MNILVSACLLGIPCRYDGGHTYHEDIVKLSNKHTLIPICPEQLGGLSTPREPAERKVDSIITKSGQDVTEAFRLGAMSVLKIAAMNHCSIAILKERSPSCGNQHIYDGSFSGNLVSGKGLCAELLEENGIKVFGESEVAFLDLNQKK